MGESTRTEHAPGQLPREPGVCACRRAGIAQSCLDTPSTLRAAVEQTRRSQADCRLSNSASGEIRPAFCRRPVRLSEGLRESLESDAGTEESLQLSSLSHAAWRRHSSTLLQHPRPGHVEFHGFRTRAGRQIRIEFLRSGMRPELPCECINKAGTGYRAEAWSFRSGDRVPDWRDRDADASPSACNSGTGGSGGGINARTVSPATELEI